MATDDPMDIDLDLGPHLADDSDNIPTAMDIPEFLQWAAIAGGC